MNRMRKCEELREELRIREELLNDEGREINWMNSTQERRRQMNCREYQRTKYGKKRFFSIVRYLCYMKL